MDINLPWVVDPKQKQPSVTLTLVIISFITVLTAGVLQITGKAENTSIMLEVFWGSLGAYLGRRITIGGKVMGTVDSTQQSEGQQ